MSSEFFRKLQPLFEAKTPEKATDKIEVAPANVKESGADFFRRYVAIVESAEGSCDEVDEGFDDERLDSDEPDDVTDFDEVDEAKSQVDDLNDALGEGQCIGNSKSPTGKMIAEGFEDKLEAAREKAAAKGKTKPPAAKAKSAVRKVDGKSYGGAKQKEEVDESDDSNEVTYGVFRKDGSIGEKKSDKPIQTFDSKEKATAYAKNARSLLSPGEKKYYKIGYSVRPLKKGEITEAVKQDEYTVNLRYDDPSGSGRIDTSWTGQAPNEDKAKKCAVKDCSSKGQANASVVRVAKSSKKVTEAAKPKEPKVYKLIWTKERTGKKYDEIGTLEELIKETDYTLATGASYQNEEGRAKINRNPANIAALVKNLNNAVNNAAKNGYGGVTYSYEEVAPKAEVTESKSLNKRVKIVNGPAKGKTGYIGEVRHGAYKGAPKTYTIDLDGGGNIYATKEDLRLIKDEASTPGILDTPPKNEDFGI